MILKALSFYGIQKKVVYQQSNKCVNDSQQQQHEAKLEPSNVDILLNNVDNLKKLNINEEEIMTSIDYGNLKSKVESEHEDDNEVSKSNNRKFYT